MAKRIISNPERALIKEQDNLSVELRGLLMYAGISTMDQLFQLLVSCGGNFAEWSPDELNGYRPITESVSDHLEELLATHPSTRVKFAESFERKGSETRRIVSVASAVWNFKL